MHAELTFPESERSLGIKFEFVNLNLNWELRSRSHLRLWQSLQGAQINVMLPKVALQLLDQFRCH